LKKKSLNRKEKSIMDEVRVFGYCENCGEKVTDEGNEYYISDDGKVFCHIECVLEHYGVTKVEI
jgi:hypothetical protein